MITYIEVNEIFKTLPVGYYLGRKIEYVLSETSKSSYFTPIEDMIVISYPMIAKAVSSMDDTDDIESIIRGLLYHEISHVFLTPPTLKDSCNYKDDRVINIVEDERIETVCKSFYMNVNFRRNIILINNYKGTAATDADSAFYHLVRFHIGTNKWLDSLHNLLMRYRTITATSDSYEVSYYKNDILSFYKNFIKDYEKNKEKMESESKPKLSDSKDDDVTKEDNTPDNKPTNLPDEEEFDDISDVEPESTSKSESEETNEFDESNELDESNTEDTNDIDGIDTIVGKDSNVQNNDASEELDSDGYLETNNHDETDDILDTIEEFEDIPIDLDIFKDIVSKTMNVYYDINLENRLMSIIESKLKKKNITGAAINGYSGRLNVKSVVRDDYRWWTQQNRTGHIKQFSKVHFNLFIDNSGSFRTNDERMNTFIRTLDRIDNPDFSFDVITINTKVVEWPNHKQRFASSGGNKLMPTIKDVIKKHQKTATNNYNIVLFDGDAHSDEWYEHYDEEPFKYFDLNNTIIISDDENTKYINKARFTRAQVKLIETNYCNHFIDTICELLERAL